MKIIFTLHAEEKLNKESAKRHNIDKKKIRNVIKNPIADDWSISPHRRIGRLSKNLSLCVIYKFKNSDIIVITFWPAEKGRYESKILRRR